MRDVARKWLSPAGFLLALMLFLLLPTVAVSCSLPAGSAAGAGELSVTATGSDLVTRATPELEASGAFAVGKYRADSVLAKDLEAATAPVAIQVLTVLLLVVCVAGIGLGVWRRRPDLTVAAAGVGGVLLVLVGNAMAGRWRQLMGDYGQVVGELPEAEGRDVAAEVVESVGLGIGFWVALGALVVAGVGAIPALRRKQASG